MPEKRSEAEIQSNLSIFDASIKKFSIAADSFLNQADRKLVFGEAFINSARKSIREGAQPELILNLLRNFKNHAETFNEILYKLGEDRDIYYNGLTNLDNSIRANQWYNSYHYA